MKVFALLLSFVLPASARADPCETQLHLASGPARVGLYDGEHGVSRRVCPKTEIGLGGTGLLLIDEPEFFGEVRVAGLLSGSWAWNDHTESFISVEVVRYETVISSVAASALGFGHTSLGSTHRFLIEETWSVGAWARLVLPTAAPLYHHAWPVSMDFGATGELAVTSYLAAHASVGGAFSAAFSRGTAQPRLGIGTNVGGGWRPAAWFAVVLDLNASFGQTAALDYVAGSLELRFRIMDHWDVTLAALAPFAGRERAQAGGALWLTWRP